VTVVTGVAPRTGAVTPPILNAVTVAAAVPETVALPPVYPVLEVCCVIVAVVPRLNPVTVSTRFDPDVEVTLTEPAETVRASQLNDALKFVIVTVNPSAVAVTAPNVGLRAAPDVAVPVTVAVPLA
jgi:hypothetical protein